MPPHHATLRKRRYHLKDFDPSHGHPIEYGMKVTNFVIGVGNIVASNMFYYPNWVTAGAWIFVAGSAIGSFFSIYDVIEERHTFVLDGGHLRFASQDVAENREKGNALLESSIFVFANVLFCIGSILFVPAIADGIGKAAARFGAWAFVIGSGLFVCAAYVNALGMAAQKNEVQVTASYKRAHRIHALNLFCAMWGALFFFTGSFLYRPGLAKECGPDDPPNCAEPAKLGTTLYVIGSVLFWIEAAGAFVSTHARADEPGENALAEGNGPSLQALQT